MLRCAALCCTALHCAALCCAVLRCAALCCTALHGWTVHVPQMSLLFAREKLTSYGTGAFAAFVQEAQREQRAGRVSR